MLVTPKGQRVKHSNTHFFLSNITHFLSNMIRKKNFANLLCTWWTLSAFCLQQPPLPLTESLHIYSTMQAAIVTDDQTTFWIYK